MKKAVVVATIAGAACAAFGGNVQLSNGSGLVVQVQNNGAHNVVFGGRDYFSPGTPVGQFFMQNGTGSGTFATAPLTNTPTVNPGTVVGNLTVTTGSFVSGSVASTLLRYVSIAGVVEVERNISILPGLNVVMTQTTIRSITATMSDFRFGETYDPDQGNFSSSTYNDRFTAYGGEAMRARDLAGRTVVSGVSPVGGFGVGGFGLSINTGSEVNNLFNGTATDPNDAYSDVGYALAFRTSLTPGQVVNWTLYHAFGDTEAAAMSGFNQAMTVIPLPSGVAMAGACLFGLGTIRRRRA
ncbi:MAG: hypothetical protein SFY69_04095 [Planctomycetota bacterium]|nr:hypothetical protein [Planctomycetota bacterium]